MRRDCAEYEDGEWCEGSYGPNSGASRRNGHLSECFSAYQGFWTRQSTYWYDIIGRFVCGEYRVADSSKDIARFWDDWMADYQRCVQFPHRKAQAGQVPNVVFVLDERAQGCRPKDVPLTGRVSQPPPHLVAAPLRSRAGVNAGDAFIRAEIDDRGYYAKIELVNAATIPADEAHFMSVVYTDASRYPVAVVHVVRSPPPVERRDEGAARARGPAPSEGAGGTPRSSAQAPASVEMTEALVEKKDEHEERISNLEESVTKRGRAVDDLLERTMAKNQELEKKIEELNEALRNISVTG